MHLVQSNFKVGDVDIVRNDPTPFITTWPMDLDSFLNDLPDAGQPPI